jgi:class 3 adenylate cyclase
MAARVASQASAGEIVVSSLLKELAASGGGIAFGGGREVELKGLAGPQVIYRISWQ